MRKKILFLMLAISLVCIFAISVNAETTLKPQTNNEYGELSFFDESITVGRIDSTHDFTPYIDAEGTTYAKMVVGDGTTFYTFPTAYLLSNSKLNGSSGKIIYYYDIASLNNAMQTATGTNPNWTKNSIYRMELPYGVTRFNGGDQKLYGYENLIELRLQPDSSTHDTNQNCLFHSCKSLEIIHNLETFVFKAGCLAGSFQNCYKLKNITLGVHENVTSLGENMFRDSGVECVNFFEAFPNLTAIDNGTFKGCKSLKTLTSTRNDGIIHFSQNYNSIGNGAFQNCDSIVAIKFTGNSVKIAQEAFNSLDSLEYIYFPRDSKLEIPSCEVFSGNNKLKAVAFPDNCTLIPDRGFKSCASLEAVYLPSNLVTIMTNGGGAGAFAYDPKLYFVQEWFNVLDENGEFLLDEFSMPQRPDVYFFPQTLTNLYDRAAGGTGFHQNFKLNPYLVFDTNVTKMIANDGLLYECGRADNPITAIFLGDMTQFNVSMRDSREKYTNYVFANANDKTIADVAIIDNSDRGCQLNGDEYFYFCHGGVKYKKIAYREAYNAANGSYVNGGTYTAELLVAEENTTHFANPNLETRTEADCVTNIVVTQFCFCTNKMGETEVENSALGHDYKEENRVYTFGSVYAKATSCIICTRQCGINSETVDEGYVIWDKGYSCSEYNNKVAVARSFSVNKELLAKFEETNGGVEIGFGITPHYDNETPNELGDFVISAALKNTNDETLYSTFSFAVAYGSDEYKDAPIYIAGYVRVNNGEVDFVDDTFETISYNSIFAKESEKAQ